MAYQWRPKKEKPKSLTVLGWLRPKLWRLSKEEIAEVLKIPVERVKNATCREHQVCISWYNEQGVTCWSFFSYRLFLRWQNQVIALIRTWVKWETWERLVETIEYEFSRFCYSIEMRNCIWHNLLEQERNLSSLRRATDDLDNLWEFEF
ncbi:MAG: hypothetical protein N3E45_16290 [Oscillatoriaceae bacterium SKW80]|nr:hypothetical protein [Oscillatoriaceae bacterium SKYG93]MCX8122358.1 hypothetical protein [Oscillatoriaceae bacterium SKW80]MDW8452466.1 hypothetical protein [Oscillatoriaceae cyanobacterium SKYGB_i_bin93]HIK27745.1 hypothetical protein [Oscillatoriaceae cyanobacterium M7585_C2015_266]